MVSCETNTNHSYSFFALLYLYVCILISYRPLSIIGNREISVAPPKKASLDYLLFFIVISSVIRFPEIISNFSNVINGFLLDSSLFYDTYNTSMESYKEVQTKSSYNWYNIILSMFDTYIPFLLMYYLTLANKKKWIIGGLIIGLIMAPMYGLIHAQRGALVNSILSCIIAYSLFKDTFPSRVNKIIKIIGSSFIIGVVLLLSMITISRFNQSFMEEGNVQRSVYIYTGQSMVNFGEYGFDTGGIRYGDRTVPLLKRLFISNGAYDYAHRMVKYHYLKLTEGLFSTYVGDFVVDYGPLLAFIIILLMSIVFYRMIYTRARNIPLYKLLAAYILAYIMICGWNLYPFADFGGNRSLLVGFVLFFYFKHFH